MKRGNSLRTVGLVEPLLLLAVSLSSIVFFLTNRESVEPHNRVLLLVCCVVGMAVALSQIACPKYLTEKGVECWRFGRKYYEITWNNVAQVCILRNPGIGAKASVASRIVIVPVGCEKYSIDNWSDSDYLSAFRKQVVAINHTKQIKEYIEQHYGIVEDPKQ